MLCKKCKTAVSETDTVCKYCGAKLSSAKKGSYIITGIVIAGLGIGALLYFNGRVGNSPEESYPIANQPSEMPVTPQPTVTPDTTPDQGIISDPEPTPDVNTDQEPEPSYTPDFEKTREQVIALVDDVAAAATDFCNQFMSYGVYTTRKGYFYEQHSDSYIRTESLAEITSINPDYVKESVLLFYLKPNDLKEFPSMSVRESDKLEVFAAYETKEGFVMASSYNPGGVLPREDLQKLLQKYNYENGAIRLLEKDSEDSRQILRAISAASQTSSDVDVRYLARDDKYAVVVISPKDAPGRINQYVLQNVNGQWIVEVFNFETSDKHQQVINSRLVDINPDLIPKYSMAIMGKYMRTNFAEVISVMKINAFIMDADGDAVFQSGTDDFVYLEFASGKKFVGRLNENKVWQMFPIANYDEAVRVLGSFGATNPPYFIIRQFG